ncbi:HAD family hydrolase [Novosphingobium sp. BL-8A]|uniref:HAD family hydrolase n=1 Tax=Novosphingobium sp. BL-8A TaxID=3127639 RepID=UPI00375706BE
MASPAPEWRRSLYIEARPRTGTPLCSARLYPASHTRGQPYPRPIGGRPYLRDAMSKTSIRAADLPKLLDIVPEDLKLEYLSLDCFDTLIWRNTESWYDLLSDLPLAGGAITRRRLAETRARMVAPDRNKRFEVTLDEIHAELLPGAGKDEHAAMVQAELDAEARHCFAFEPTRQLILDAKRRGLKVIIVSDTYLSEKRLRSLISDVGGADLAAMIDKIFCSCEYGVNKHGGLFRFVLKELRIQPEQMLHVGDNFAADLAAARQLNIPSVHFVQFDTQAQQRLRMEAAAASIIDPATRVTVPAYQPHRAQIALRTEDDPTYAFGHDILGPIMHGFASWIREEAEAMEAATGKKVKLLFLQRDGHLPARAFAALHPDWAERAVEVAISRVIAVGSSFIDEAAVREHMTPWLVPHIEKTLEKALICARQLLFDGEETAKLLEGDLEGFGKRVMQAHNLKKVLKRSAAFRERMMIHLRSAGVEQGDAVMMVDLGCNGSVQNATETFLRTDMKLDVAGRYLLLREHVPSGLDKKGYFDTRNYDFNVLTTVFNSISTIEQFCTMSVGSALDYDSDGTPIREMTSFAPEQRECRNQGQEACLDFIREVGKGFVNPPRSNDKDSRRRAAMAVLSRLLLMPVEAEVGIFSNFRHDANFGVDAMLEMANPETALRSIRRRGLYYMRTAGRTYVPGELQQFGLPLNLSIFSIRRFNLEFAKGDVDVDALQLPIQVYGGGESVAKTVGAHRTADGFFRAIVPVGRGQFSIGLFLGRLFQFVQLEEVSLQPASSLTTEDATPVPIVTDGMEEVAPGLYRIEAPEGFLIVPAVPSEDQMLLSLVFRPIITRAEAQAVENRRVA